MRVKNLMNFILVAGLLAGVFAALVPTASAQQAQNLVITVTANDQKVKPLQGAVQYSATAELTYDQSAQAGVIGVPVAFTPGQKPNWASVLISPTNAIFNLASSGTPGASASQKATVPLTITVTATQDAPAFSPETVIINAQTNPSQPGKPISGTGQFQIVADYFSILDVQVAEPVKVERPQVPVLFPVKITNLGNANTKITWTVHDSSPGLVVPVPPQLVVQSKQAGGTTNTADVTLTVQTPFHNGYLNEVGTVNYDLKSAYAIDPNVKGDSATVSLLITTRGFYVPGPELGLLLGAVIVVAALVRKARSG